MLQSSRKYCDGVEIDLLSIENGVGIEYNGNFYHTELYGKNKYYHLNKTLSALNNNINLYHIHEDEWTTKKIIIKKLLLKIFNVLKNSINVNDIIFKETTKHEKKAFLTKNHILGNDKSNIFIGGYYMNNLVALISLKQIKNTYQLNRLAVDLDYNIYGVEALLLTYFINKYNPNKITTLIDRRWNPNVYDSIYINLGFKCVQIYNPDYSYYKKTEHNKGRQHKLLYTKSSIKRNFSHVYNENKTEWEMMQELKYDRIWDCGKIKYELIIN